MRRSSLAALALGGLLVAGCYSFSEPSFDPGNKRDVLQSIARRGLVVSQPVVGQTACDDPDLVANSLYLTARLPDEREPRDVYVHSYREKSWAGSEAEVDECQAIYAAAHPGCPDRAPGHPHLPRLRRRLVAGADPRAAGRHRGGRAGRRRLMTESPALSSRQNPRFKAALALRDARERRERRRLLVDGTREIGRALDAGLDVVEAWVAPERVRSQEAGALLPRLRSARAELLTTTPALLGALAYGDRDDGIVIVATEPATDLGRLSLPERPLVAVVEQVEKPGNLGALMRSADGAGVDAVIVADALCDPWNPNAIRASQGTIFSLPMAVCTSAEALAWLRQQGIAIVTARVDGTVDYDAVDLRGGVAIVVGAETTGLGAAWSGEDVTAVRIPMLGLADSLNVSASAAVLFYEARRQRRAATGS